MNITSYKNYLSSHGNSVGQIKKNQSDFIMDQTFDRDPAYKQGMLYNANLEPIEMVDFKFQKAQVYTINKDQVEYFIQFRPGYHPEKKHNTANKTYRLYNDEKERISFYLDIPDDNGDVYKWLLVGRNNDNAFVRYNVLQCNWTFEWMIDRQYYNCLGVVRSRNNYNSGVWSDGYTTSVENQTQFFVPTNNVTRTVDYDVRFMITDNPIHPKTYEVSKVEDTFPLGLLKITLVQDHFNVHTDVCKILDGELNTPDELRDGKVHMICNYIKSGLPPVVNRDDAVIDIPTDVSAEWYLSDVGEKLYINSTMQTIYALSNNDTAYFDDTWNVYLDNTLYDWENGDLDGYFECNKNIDDHSFSIKAINKDLAGYIVKISIGSKASDYYDFVEMEVVN